MDGETRVSELVERVAGFGACWLSRAFKEVPRYMLRYAGTIVSAVPLALNSVLGEGAGVAEEIADSLAEWVRAAGFIIIGVSSIMLAAGLIFRFIPTGSTRTKDFGGLLIDHAVLLGAFCGVGLFLLWFAGWIGAKVAGMPEPQRPGSQWELPRFGD